MSETDLQAPFNGFRGRIGKLVFKQRNGRVIVSHMPDPNRPLSDAEITLRSNFTEASKWAKLAFQDGELRAFYEELAPNMVFTRKGKTRKGTTPHSAAVTDFLVAPTIKAFDFSEYNGEIGDQMYFVATDNVGVNFATVEIDDPDGNRLETGDAVLVNAEKGSWTYTATRAVSAGSNVKITVKAYDRPGHLAEVSEAKAI